MNEATTDIRHVTGTAFVVAEFRACENAERHPLYVDRVVPIFLDARTRAAADAIRADFPAAEMNVRLRTRYFDDRLDEQLARGCRQIVILGAGLAGSLLACLLSDLGYTVEVYERRPDVGAVVHAHPPYATAISASRGNPIERPFIAEAFVSLGPVIPKLPYAQPGEDARKALAPWCELVDVVLLGNHGVIAWGADPEQALAQVLGLVLIDLATERDGAKRGRHGKQHTAR